jgi:hypothetical protein
VIPVAVKAHSQWQRFLDEAFSGSIARGDTNAPRRVAVSTAIGLVLFTALATATTASPALLGVAGLAFGLSVGLVEAALWWRRLRLAKLRRLR